VFPSVLSRADGVRSSCRSPVHRRRSPKTQQSSKSTEWFDFRKSRYTCQRYRRDRIRESMMIWPVQYHSGETHLCIVCPYKSRTRLIFLANCRKTSTRVLPNFRPYRESRRRRRRCFATICGTAVRKRRFVWRRGEEFERLILLFWN
jgi:hypothetical protein